MRSPSIPAVVACLLLLALGGGPLLAQSIFGTILGAVTDPNGALMPGTQVTLTHQETNITRQAATNEAGLYEFPNLVAGTYRVELRREGFKAFVKGDIALGYRQTVRVDAVMELGALTESVTVTYTPGLLETDTSSLGTSIAGGEVHFLSPTTDSQRPWTLLRLNPLVQNTASGTRFSIAGAYPSQSEFQVDGITSPIGSGSPAGSTLMTAEGVQEVRVLGGNNSAEYASPAVYQQISKSGGNALRGDVYYYYNAPGLNARVATSATGKPSLIFHQFGGNVNGPIRLPKLYNGRDRTFFSLSWQSKRQGGTQLYSADVPTLTMRNGVFSRSVLDPDNNRTPFPNNTIPASRINPVSRNIQTTYYPEPNTPDPNAITRNHQTIGPSGTTREEALDLRLDHRVGDRHWLYGSVGGSQFNNRAYDSGLPTMGFRVSTRKLYHGAVSYTYNLSASLLNELRAGFMRDNSPAGGARNGLEVLRELGIQFPSSLPAPDVRGFPVINITGLTALTQQNTTTNISASYQLTDMVSWIHNRHTFKGGLNVYLEQPNYWQIPSGAFGSFFFQGATFSAVPYADFLLGIPAYVTTTGINPNQYIRGTNYGLFFQDDYKVRRDLTLNLGLRWDYQGPVYNKNSALYNFDLATGGMIKAAENTPVNSAFAGNYPNVKILEAAQAGLPQRTLRFADGNNLAPRTGFAWRPRGSSSFVVRGAWGKFTDIIGHGVMGTQASGGFLNRGNSRYDNTAPLFRFPYPFPAVVTGEAAPPSLTANGFNPRMANPYVQQWNLTLEKSLWETAFRASYVGTKTTNLLYNRDVNQRVTPGDTTNRSRPYSASGYGGTIAYLDNGGNQIYHGLILEARRRFRNGFMFQAGYAFAKNISDIVESENDANGTSSNAFSRSLDRGQVGYQRRHNFSAMGLWTLPLGRGQKLLNGLPAWASYAVSGWGLSPELFAGSGQYFTPCRSGTNPLTGATCGQVGRPDRIGDGNNGPKQTGSASVKWFDPSAFSNPAANVLGNSGRNVLLGPGFWHLSLSLTKRFRFLEKKELWFSLSSENLCNHPNWNNPSSTAELTVGQPAFGSTASLMGSDRAAQRFPSRNIWLRMRVLF